MRFLWVPLSLMVLTACGGGPASPSTEFIAIKSITPVDGTAVKTGTTVSFAVAVTSTIVNFNSGRVVMIVTDQVGRTVQPTGRPQPNVAVAKGTATVELSDSVTVPADALAIEVVLALFVEGSDRTAVFVKARYPVQ